MAERLEVASLDGVTREVGIVALDRSFVKLRATWLDARSATAAGRLGERA